MGDDGRGDVQERRAQVAAMDRHVDAMLARLDQPATWPIVWYRGSLLGLDRCAIYDMALGSEVGKSPPGADGLTETDRHEVAHCVISRNCTGRSDPPRVLMEGWAQANQGTPAEELTCRAWDDHEKGRSLTLRQMVAPDWYWYSGLAAYNQGAVLVNYLLRVYGPEAFLNLYTTCQQATFDADCRATLRIGLDELDAACWADTEQIVRRAGPPTRIWLKSLKLEPGVDPAAWDAFLADYFAAAKRLLAPYDHVRLTTVFRAYSDGQGAHPWYEQRQELIRSGPLARVRLTDKRDDLAYLTGPDRSIEARRSLRSPNEPWTIREVPRSSLEQSYRRACNGGMVLLRYPQEPKLAGFSTDYEVVELKSATTDGHRLVTLRLRASPEVEGRRDDCSFVFDADEMFVVLSEREISGTGRSRTDTITTAREDGRSFRSSPRRTSLQPRRSCRHALRSRSAASARFRNPSSPRNRFWPACRPARSSGSRSKNPRLGRSSTGTGWRSSAAGSAWQVGLAWPWEAATATDGPCGRIERDVVASVAGSAPGPATLAPATPRFRRGYPTG